MTNGATYFRRVLGWVWWAGRWALLLAVVGAVYYQFQFAPLPVETTEPVRADVIDEVMGTGTLEARVSTTVSPKISGRIGQVLVDQGERVQRGKLLVQLDDDEFKQQVAIADANVETAQAAVMRLQADKARALAVFEQAQRHHARVKALSQTNVTTLEDLERAAEALAVATAETARAEAAIVEGQKALVAAEKTLEYHRARLVDTTITAPFDGLIVARHREAGDVAMPGSAVLTLIATEVLWVRAWVDETQMGKLAVDQPARVVFRSQPDRGYSGTVTRLGKQADRETREFVVDVRAAELPENWAVGQRAEVYIQTGRAEAALTVPPDFILRREGSEGIFLMENGVASWRPVKLGMRGREFVEVREGLTESDTVIRPQSGGAPLEQGRRVRLP